MGLKSKINVDAVRSEAKDNLDKIFNMTIDYFINEESYLINRLQSISDGAEYAEVKEQVTGKAKEKFRTMCTDRENVQRLMERFDTYMFGYYVLEPLLHDRSISDVKVYDYCHVRVKRNGRRESTDISFVSPEDYNRFVRTICARNKANISNINALGKFSDSVNNPMFRLRINFSSERINTNGQPEMHIRLIPKKKVTIEKLVKVGYMTEIQAEYIKRRFCDDEWGILFVGPNASGKTTGINALLDIFPEDRSALVMQETDELFNDTHPDIGVQHTLEDNGEGVVRYGLKELANQALMDDIDTFVLGEVKSGADAASIPMLSATGSQIILSSHGDNETDGLLKLGDYIKQATGYELEQCLRFLTGIKLVCYVKRYKIQSMSEVHGWDYGKNELIIKKLDSKCKLSDDNYAESGDEMMLDDISAFIIKTRNERLEVV